MKNNIRTITFAFILTSLISCHNETTVPNHFTHEFNFTDLNGKQAVFYGFRNIDTAIHYAKIENKRILILFSGYACMSESDKEWRTLSYYGDNNKIQNNFILLWLAVDDKELAGDTNQIVYWYGKVRKLRTIGDQNKYYQEILTETSTQPTLCFIESNKYRLGKTLGYSKDPAMVKDFIRIGLDPNSKGEPLFFPSVPTECEWVEGDTVITN